MNTAKIALNNLKTLEILAENVKNGTGKIDDLIDHLDWTIKTVESNMIAENDYNLAMSRGVK